MKKLLTGEKNRTKKNTTEKMITPMPMGRKQKKWMSLYMALVLTVTVGATTAFAAGDPLSVINNLSTFIFSLIRAIGLILLGFGVVQVGLSLKSHDPSQRANGFLTLAGGGNYYVRQRNPRFDYGVSLFEKIYQETAGVPEGTPVFKNMFKEVRVFE